MPVPIDTITLKKLILVKQIYQQAVVQSTSQYSIVGRILPVISFDLAVETVLRAIVGSLDPSKTPNDAFQGLVQQCDSLLATAGCNPIPDKANIQYIHSIRNDAQHKAKYPNESDVNDSRTYCRDFLQKVIADVWGLEFEKISLVDAIQDETVRQFLIKAETALSQKDYHHAIEYAAIGLALALNSVRKTVVGQLPPSRQVNRVEKAFRKLQLDFDVKDIYEALERMQETLLYIALGMNYTIYMKYKSIAGQVLFFLGGDYLRLGGKENPDANDAEFVVAYCADTVVQIESRVGNLNVPIGLDQRY